MLYKITSKRIFKRYQWFVGADYGISMETWFLSKASVTLNGEYLDADQDGQFELDNLLKEIAVRTGPDDELEINYPFPYFFKDPSASVIWDIPNLDNSTGLTGRNNKLLIDPSSVKIRLFLQLNSENKLLRKNFTTFDDEFKWVKLQFGKASKYQSEQYYIILAEIWNSECWRSEEALENHMKEKLDLELDENEAIFLCPNLELIK